MKARHLGKHKRPDVSKPPPKNLTPLSTKLVDWDTLKMSSLLSVMPEEGEQRAGLIEEYLWGFIQIIREKNANKAEVTTRERESFFADEEEERRFLTDDGDHMALRGFIRATEETAQQVIIEWEEQSRAELMKAHKEYLAEAFAVLEEIHRMHVATQAFDSTFLKLCQVNPYWLWRKLKFVEDEQREAERKQQRMALYEEQLRERHRHIDEYNRCYATALEMLAFSEKVDIFQKHEVIFSDTCRVILEDSAIKIQAAFRGHQVRKKVRMW